MGANGKQKRKSVTAKTKTELMKRVNELMATSGKPTGEKMYFKDIAEPKDPKEAATLVVADFWGLLVPMVIPEIPH